MLEVESPCGHSSFWMFFSSLQGLFDEFQEVSPARFYVNRVVGGDCDHRRPDRLITASGATIT